RRARAADGPAVERLLRDAELPLDGVADAFGGYRVAGSRRTGGEEQDMNATRTRRTSLPLAAPAPPAGGVTQLARDAAALQRALSDLIRVYQFRDRDRICCHDISVSQCYALEALVERGPLTLNDLAAHLYLDKSTASRVVDGLERKGLARRGAHPQDGRAVLLSATPAGARLCRRIQGELVLGQLPLPEADGPAGREGV